MLHLCIKHCNTYVLDHVFLKIQKYFNDIGIIYICKGQKLHPCYFSMLKLKLTFKIQVFQFIKIISKFLPTVLYFYIFFKERISHNLENAPKSGGRQLSLEAETVRCYQAPHPRLLRIVSLPPQQPRKPAPLRVQVPKSEPRSRMVP